MANLDADVGKGGHTHHALAPHESILLLDSDEQVGLSSHQARDRLDQFGPNALPEVAGTPAWKRWLLQFHNPLIYVLLASSAITIVLGEYVDSIVILTVVLVNAIIGYVQESRAHAALAALRSMVSTTARVVRGGVQSQVESTALVPGDIVLVEAGDKLPADMRLLTGTEVRCDESALTGESLPVPKSPLGLPVDTEVADRANMLYSGTLVTSGLGRGIVVGTGDRTQLGQIHRLVSSADSLATPLTRKLEYFSKILTVVILGLAAIAFGVGLWRGETAADMFVASVALAVGAIPEGLPAAVTITLAIGVSRMAARQAVVRRLPVVETLGSTTVICTDKTGTLTQNQMTVQQVLTPATNYVVTGEGLTAAGAVRDATGRSAADDPLAMRLIDAGALCNDAAVDHRADGTLHPVGDPTETALLICALKSGTELSELSAEYPRIGAIPFTSERQFMATLHESASDQVTGSLLLMKGSVERVLDRCTSRSDGQPWNRREVEEHVAHLADDGLRVLAFAAAEGVGPQLLDDLEEGNPVGLSFLGLQAMWDPPRPAAERAVEACHTAGISVRMITGDHAGTAAAIASHVGLLTDGAVISGRDIDPDSPDFADQVAETEVFARVTPEQKLALVSILQSRGEVVAMTGDGVNDAPALRQADIGVAMGRGGTEVAKESADMVLVDDDFATIEGAVEEGRGVFDNITKFIAWTLPTNLGEGFVILAAILLGTALPILPVQILWINMTTAVLLGLMLAFEAKEAGIMTRPPRDPKTPLLTRTLVERIALVSVLLVAASWWMFTSLQDSAAGIEVARTAAVNTFVVIEAFYLFSCRSLVGPSWRLGWFSNRWLLAGVALQTVAQIAITYLPFMNSAFQTAPLEVGTWLQILLLGVGASAAIALHKRLTQGRELSSAVA